MNKALPEYLSYDKETGEIHWAKSPARRVSVGDLAGVPHNGGYKLIHFRGRNYFFHRVAWFLATGETPETVDHIDGDRSNNRFENLRPATYSENNRNVKARADNTSGYKGVIWTAKRRKWEARIMLNKKNHHLGRFETAEEAAHAYNKAAVRLHGDFAVLNPVGGCYVG